MGRNDKKKQKRKKSENAVHIYHHTDRKEDKDSDDSGSLEAQLYDIARRRKETADEALRNKGDLGQ